MRTRKPSRRAFTLMEVLLVLVILVILASLVSVFYLRAQKTSMINAARTQIGMLESALKLYYLDMQSYPTTTQGLESLRLPPGDLANPAKWNGPYLEKDVPLDPWSNPYGYSLIDSENIHIWSRGPDGTDGTADDISNHTNR